MTVKDRTIAALFAVAWLLIIAASWAMVLR